jgi:hypothetical protein
MQYFHTLGVSNHLFEPQCQILIQYNDQVRAEASGLFGQDLNVLPCCQGRN